MNKPKTEELGQIPFLLLVQSHPALVSIAGLACKEANSVRVRRMADLGEDRLRWTVGWGFYRILLCIAEEMLWEPRTVVVVFLR